MGARADDAAERRFRFELAAHPSSAAQARRLTRAGLAGWSVGDETCTSAVLVVSELITNAIVHTASAFIVCEVQDGPDSLRIAVRDEGCAPGEICPAPRLPEEEHGRGLLLVEAVSEAWGIQEQGLGLLVWAELAHPAVTARQPATDVQGHRTVTDGDGRQGMTGGQEHEAAANGQTHRTVTNGQVRQSATNGHPRRTAAEDQRRRIRPVVHGWRTVPDSGEPAATEESEEVRASEKPSEKPEDSGKAGTAEVTGVPEGARAPEGTKAPEQTGAPTRTEEIRGDLGWGARPRPGPQGEPEDEDKATEARQGSRIEWV